MVTADRESLPAIGNYRHRKILELLFEKGIVSADELAKEFGVSKITIRRDLDALASKHLLERTRGGAAALPHAMMESMFEQKDSVAKREKALIGRYVASLVKENDTIFLNAGSTTLEVLKHLGTTKVNVITNNAAATGIDVNPAVELIMLGGEYRPQSRSLIGELTLIGIRHAFANLTILGVNGINLKGCTSAVYQETTVNSTMMEQTSGKIVIVADHSKINAVSSFLTCPLARINLLVTDWLSPPLFLEQLEEAGVEVAVVREED
jgi:DeoR family transcriptional regulator, fructose operon transcriptional repressor